MMSGAPPQDRLIELLHTLDESVNEQAEGKGEAGSKKGQMKRPGKKKKSKKFKNYSKKKKKES